MTDRCQKTINAEGLNELLKRNMDEAENLITPHILTPSEYKKLTGDELIAPGIRALQLSKGMIGLNDTLSLINQAKGKPPYSVTIPINPYVTTGKNNCLIVDVPDSLEEIDTIGKLSDKATFLFEGLVSLKVELVVFTDDGPLVEINL